ncbi:hypothetical protein [Pseudonocardia xishanensis]|uniref:Uncharacterized protein n=1 Tax=Pseudonocardia xishanensis TaxID=630995 RepID=A0ABP8RZL8_9PSEU
MSAVNEIIQDLRERGVLSPRHQWTPTGWEAHFVYPYGGSPADWREVYSTDLEHPGERSTIYSLPVEDWTPDGEPLVVDAREGRRKRASEIDGFVKLVRTDKLHSALQAEHGWQAELDLPDGADTVPVVAWLVGESGVVRPVIDKVRTFGGQLADNEGELVPIPALTVLRLIAP